MSLPILLRKLLLYFIIYFLEIFLIQKRHFLNKNIDYIPYISNAPRLGYSLKNF